MDEELGDMAEANKPVAGSSEVAGPIACGCLAVPGDPACLLT